MNHPGPRTDRAEATGAKSSSVVRMSESRCRGSSIATSSRLTRRRSLKRSVRYRPRLRPRCPQPQRAGARWCDGIVRAFLCEHVGLSRRICGEESSNGGPTPVRRRPALAAAASTSSQHGQWCGGDSGNWGPPHSCGSPIATLQRSPRALRSTRRTSSSVPVPAQEARMPAPEEDR